MTYCVVKGCSNSSHKHLNHIRFHVFPTDPIVASQWTKQIRLNRKEDCWKPKKYTKICSIHFEDSKKYITKGGLCRLRPDAVPTKGLHIFCSEECDTHGDLHEFLAPETQLGASCNDDNENLNLVTSSASQELIYPNEANDKIIKQETNEPLISPENDTELEYIYDTPQMAALRRQLAKKTVTQRRQRNKLKVLQQQVRRLKQKNLSLQKIIVKLAKEKNN